MTRVECPYCGSWAMRATQVDPITRQPDGWRCDGCPGLVKHRERQSVILQRQMVADLHERGAALPGFREPTLGTPLTLGELFDAHALTLLVVHEVEERAAGSPR